MCFITRTRLAPRNNRKIATAEAEGRPDDSNEDILTNLHAFEDLTDLENPDFRYSL